MKKKSQIDMGAGSIRTLILQMGLPIMIGMVFTALDSIGDALFVGRLGVAPLSAIYICAPIGQAIVALGLLFGNGAGAYLPRLLGAKKTDTANKVASTALFGSLFCGLLAAVLIFCNLPGILRALGADGDTLHFALSYARVYVPSLLLNVFIVTMNSISSSEGHARLVLRINTLTAILNFVLNPVLIYGLHMGIAGAAYATVIAQGIATLVLLGHILLRKSMFQFQLCNVCLKREIITPIFQVGLSTLVFQLLTSGATWLTNRQAAQFGDATIAALGTCMRIFSIGTLLIFGFAKGFQAIAGYNFGAKNIGRVREALRFGIQLTTGFCVLFSILCGIFAPNILQLFSSNQPAVLSLGTTAMRLQSVSFIFFGVYTIYSSLLLSLGKVREGFVLGLCRQGICLLPILLLLPALFGQLGLFLAQPIADILSILITLGFARITAQFLQRVASESTLPFVS